MTRDFPAYGLCPLVAATSIIFIMFAFSFNKPRSPRDWRSCGMFIAFIVALFAEMYGFQARLQFDDARMRYLTRLAGWLPHLDSRGTQSGAA